MGGVAGPAAGPLDAESAGQQRLQRCTAGGGAVRLDAKRSCQAARPQAAAPPLHAGVAFPASPCSCQDVEALKLGKKTGDKLRELLLTGKSVRLEALKADTQAQVGGRWLGGQRARRRLHACARPHVLPRPLDVPAPSPCPTISLP